jgi:hypothetical protein
MAKEVIVRQSASEERIYPLDFSDALLEDVTLEDISFIYTGDNDDDEDDLPDYDAVIVGNIAYVSVSGLIVGEHTLQVIAGTSNADLSPVISLLITVKF